MTADLRRVGAPPNSYARAWAAGLAALALLASAGPSSAAAFVDAGVPDIKAGDWVKVARPQPVQLLFQFQTKGAPNGRATTFLKQTVVDTVKNSGLFSEVDETPVANGAVLNIVINNVVDPKQLQEAEGKGAVTGATMFLAGNSVRDSYVCTVDYVAGPNAPTITKTAHHGVIVQIGIINSTPTNAVKVGSTKDAVFTMARECVSNPLNEIAADPGFQASASTPQAPASPSPPETTPPPAAPPSSSPASSGAPSGPQPQAVPPSQ
jgi:hypothetical protein